MKIPRTCYILRGYPGSGKSFVADRLSKEPNTKVVSADFFWIDSKGNYNFVLEKLSEAHSFCFDQFKLCIKSGINVVIDNTNLKYKDIQKYIDYLLTNNNLNDYIYSVNFQEVSYNNLEKAISLRSNQSNGKNIPEDKMRMMYRIFKDDIRPMLLNDYKGKIGLSDLDLLENNLPWKESEEKYPAIICDLDGTLSIFEYTNGMQIRSPYDGSKCHLDFICKPVAEALRAFYNLGYAIIFVSGREEKFRTQTFEFLERVKEEYGITWLNLYMRPSGDFRKDTVIKDEIYSKYIEEKYNVLCVFDDRKIVVDHWRSKGLFVFDCNYRGKEF